MNLMDKQVITFNLSIEEFKEINIKLNTKQPIGNELLYKLLKDHSEVLKYIAFSSEFVIQWHH